MAAEEAVVPVTDEGLVRGDGVFEVVRLYAGRPFAWEDHLRRLTNSASNLRLEIDINAVRMQAEALVATAEGEYLDGQLRVMVTRGGRIIGLLETLAEHAAAVRLASVTYAPPRILDGVKSLSYAGNMLATRLAKEAGAEEALLVTPHGRVLEAPTSSLFYVIGSELRTPPLSDHILDSITRRRLLAALDVAELPVTLEELLGCEEAFLASTTREVQAIASIDATGLAAAPGPRTREAAEVFSGIVAEELAGART